MRSRDAELAALLVHAEAVQEGAARLVTVAGPRRTGKTLLVRHLLESLPAGMVPFYFEATQSGEPAELARFALGLRQAIGDAFLPPSVSPRTWEEALGWCSLVASSRPLAVVIDEATYLMGSNPAFSSQVQAAWDGIEARADQPQLLVVLTGSAVGLMEDALDHGGALYQRPNLNLRLEPLTAAQAWVFAGQPEPASLIEAYAVCGGYPLHLDSWDFSRSLRKNLETLAGTPGGILLENANLILASLPDHHRRALISVGQGRTRLSEVANDVGTRVERPMDALVRSRQVVAARPLTAPRQARPEYRVADTYMRFFLRVLAHHVQLIEAGQGAAVLAQSAEALQEQLGWTFEAAAREHAVDLVRRGELPEGTLIGEWWTSSGQQHQVDVLGMLGGRTTVLGEARWQAQPLSQRDVDELAGKLSVVPSPAANPQLILWGRQGLLPEAVNGAVRGYTPEEILAR